MSYRKKAEIAVGEDQTYREEKINLWVCYWFDSSYQKTLVILNTISGTNLVLFISQRQFKP